MLKRAYWPANDGVSTYSSTARQSDGASGRCSGELAMGYVLEGVCKKIGKNLDGVTFRKGGVVEPLPKERVESKDRRAAESNAAKEEKFGERAARPQSSTRLMNGKLNKELGPAAGRESHDRKVGREERTKQEIDDDTKAVRDARKRRFPLQQDISSA